MVIRLERLLASLGADLWARDHRDMGRRSRIRRGSHFAYVSDTGYTHHSLPAKGY